MILNLYFEEIHVGSKNRFSEARDEVGDEVA